MLALDVQLQRGRFTRQVRIESQARVLARRVSKRLDIE